LKQILFIFLITTIIISCNSDSCKRGGLETRACGEDNKGEQSRVCISGEWSIWMNCNLPIECSNDEIENQNCGIDNKGTQNRLCKDNKWEEWSECEMPSECTNDEIENQNCGIDNKGTQNRLCKDNKWEEWSECEMPNESCIDNEVKEGSQCGINGIEIQVCRDGNWSEVICHENDGEYRSFTVYIKTENNAITSYLMDAVNSAWNYFNSIHIGLRGDNNSNAVAYHPALRFENIQLPQNAEVVDVSLSFYPNSDVDNDKVRINIYAENSVSSMEFDVSDYNNNRPDQRLKTTLKVPADTSNPESWRIQCVSDCCKDEPDCNRLWRYDCPQRKLDCWKKDIRFVIPYDLSPIISEVISLDNWVNGNPVTIFFESALDLNNGDEIGSRTINDFDERGIEYNPSLTIKYKVTN